MKNVILSIICLYTLGCRSTYSEKLKYGSGLPSLTFQMIDSVSLFNTNAIIQERPLVFMYFMTDCEHCHEETINLLHDIDSLDNIQFFLITPKPLNELRIFYVTYHLNKYKNITVGRDMSHEFYNHFKPPTIPYMAIYNKDKKLIKICLGNVAIKELKQLIQG